MPEVWQSIEFNYEAIDTEVQAIRYRSTKLDTGRYESLLVYQIASRYTAWVVYEVGKSNPVCHGVGLHAPLALVFAGTVGLSTAGKGAGFNEVVHHTHTAGDLGVHQPVRLVRHQRRYLSV